MSPQATVYTLGHSNRSLQSFLGLVGDGGLKGIADVRSYPGSRRHPHFAGAPLAAALEARGTSYLHLPALGGHRPAPDETNFVAALEPVWQGYGAHMQSALFSEGLARLLAFADGHAPVGVLCAERDPDRCHRQLLSDAIEVAGLGVVHLIDVGERRRHERHPSCMVTGEGITYPARQATLFD